LAQLGQRTRAYFGEHLTRRSGQVVQDRPSVVVGWADIPELSMRVGRCSAPWLQSRRNGADPRPSAFQAGRSPQVVIGRASVLGRSRSLVLAVGCCCCCQAREDTCCSSAMLHVHALLPIPPRRGLLRRPTTGAESSSVGVRASAGTSVAAMELAGALRYFTSGSVTRPSGLQWAWSSAMICGGSAAM
jgi:hypothetical protein